MDSKRILFIDPPGPYAPMKELQDFLDRWEKEPEPHPPELRDELQEARRAIAWQRKHPHLFPDAKDEATS